MYTLPENQRPREKMLYGSVKSLSDAELLQVLLITGDKNNSVDRLAQQILEKAHGNLFEMENWSIGDFKVFRGVDEAKACLLVAAIELGVRVARKRAENRINCSSSDDVKNLFVPEMRSLLHEEFHLIMLNTKLEIIGRALVSSGGLSSACAEPGKVFMTPLKKGARAIIIAHNHPSGDINPSKADIATTRQLSAAGKLLGIELLDHIIVGGSAAYSFRENGLL